MIIIYNIESILHTNFKIKKPFTYGDKTIFDLYNETNEPLYYQSPSMIVPYNYFINNNIFTLTLCEYKNTKYTDLIDNVIKKIIDKVKKNYSNLFENKIFNNPIIVKPFNPKMFQFKNVKTNDIEIYNIFQEKIDLQDIRVDDMITCIYQIKNIWINENSYGVKLNLIQLRRDNTINRGYIFTDKKTTIIEPLSLNLNKYVMMIKSGIPISGIKQKMKNDNIDEITIVNFISKYNKLDIHSQILNHKNNIQNKVSIENNKELNKEKNTATVGVNFAELLARRISILNKNKD